MRGHDKSEPLQSTALFKSSQAKSIVYACSVNPRRRSRTVIDSQLPSLTIAILRIKGTEWYTNLITLEAFLKRLAVSLFEIPGLSSESDMFNLRQKKIIER